ncbi:autophagy-related protein 18 [Marchantia polymorpha subsp. ruderalis]|uniref:BCAS3 domain-containing protein n=2 Tax=Marchantia polymorpha TaxID=3197 RepID=A0A176WF64_MARPO|nr:hypothetical protein AXG93_1276s1040 [Marchantia polymorpha subsp. ruderalis]PTQ42919.1 hypothetical protein MARPO_0027s0044 [Marchantia polymorpha]PTQ42920.1 hypothetical protein MARPO_0027s0044 [Marchantia polymorpha]BBN10714.1 hypothetical protein Mp_5g05830 [Marchantia polymorpha subsp. ruderalis]BBN10715.1 hypothetical protein Mp_5g05830 [Marchantia polymorpha subsp. ruderalis]|eukprot:PTQ42919.1 hypothetical protein MARPO_0027s0044 [Marchantia polymorpha]
MFRGVGTVETECSARKAGALVVTGKREVHTAESASGADDGQEEFEDIDLGFAKQQHSRWKMAEQTGGARVIKAGFNQDHSLVGICTREGAKIFDCDTVSCVYEHTEGAYSLLNMLNRTSLIAVVGAGEQPELSPRRLNVINTTRGSRVEMNFFSAILAVGMNLKRLVVVLEKKAYIHEMSSLNCLECLDTVPNPKGLCALSPNEDNCYLALPARTDVGAVLIHDALNLHALCQIHAHQSPLAAMAISADGNLLATASSQGTIIRVHVIPRAAKAYTFRRGSVPCAIYSLSFGPPQVFPQLLAATGASGTVHVFKLGPLERPPRSQLASSLLSAVMPPSMADMYEPERCCITIHHGCPPGVVSYCAVAGPPLETGDDGRPCLPRSNRPRVFVVTSAGYFHEYFLNLGSGREPGSFTLERECALISNPCDQVGAHFV